MEQQPAQRVVLLAVLEERVDVQVVPQLPELVDGRAPVDPGPVVVEPDDHRLLHVVLVLDLAHDLLELVLDRDEPGGPPVRLRDEQRRSEERADGRRIGGCLLEEPQEVLRVEDPDDLVDRLLPDREAAVPLRDDPLDGLLERPPDLEPHDVDPGNHDLVDAPLTELDDRVDHLLLLGLENALLSAALHDQLQLLRADLGVRGDARPERPGDGPGQPGQEADHGAQHVGDHLDRLRKGQREAFRVGERERLGDQLGEDDREEGDDDRDDDERDGMGAVPKRVDPDQDPRETVREADRGVCRREEPEKRQAQLRDGQEATGIVEQALDAPRRTAPLVHELLDPAVPDRDQRDLRGHEEPFEQGQDDDDADLDEEVHQRSDAGVGPGVASG